MTVSKKKPQRQLKLTKSETRVGYEQTVNEIQRHLIKAGAKKISFDYDETELPYNITFSYNLKNGTMMLFSLPIRFNGIAMIMKKQGGTSRGGELQPINTAWRIMKDWIISQLALVEAEMAELPEVFLPYAITKTGETFYDVVKKDTSQLLIG